MSSVTKDHASILENIGSIHPKEMKKTLELSRGLNHTVSGVGLGVSAAGIGAGSAALAGCAVVPFIGWAIAGIGFVSLGAKIAIDQTINK